MTTVLFILFYYHRNRAEIYTDGLFPIDLSIGTNDKITGFAADKLILGIRRNIAACNGLDNLVRTAFGGSHPFRNRWLQNLQRQHM